MVKIDPQEIGRLLSQLGAMMQTGSTGAAGWDGAKQVARSLVVQAGDESVSENEKNAISQAVSLAQTWLDGATSFPAHTTQSFAWSRSEWIETTMPIWQRLVDPIAKKVQANLGANLQGMLQSEQLPEEMMAMMGPMMDALKPMSSAMFTMQVGNGIGELAKEVLSSNEIGLPLTNFLVPALLPKNIKTFAKGVEQKESEVILFLSLREAAASRLFANTGWLGPRLLGAIEEYSQGIGINTEKINEAMREIDPMNPESLQQILGGGVFEVELSDTQKSALNRIEFLLALIEGWVEQVTLNAAQDKLPSLIPLSETMRRRRAAGGPAEKTFSALVGLALRPKLNREAGEFFKKFTELKSSRERDLLWSHPDLLPSEDQLEAVESFINQQIPLDLSKLDDPDSDNPNSSTASK
ncbi:MAG: zinc-dependent metalloprotease [Candidatus Nanopelagicales bacterium]